MGSVGFVDLATLAQIVTSITNTLFVIVLAVGYYYTWRTSQQTLNEMREQRVAMGRPLVIVQEDYTTTFQSSTSSYATSARVRPGT
ncbi:MAG: hypothetical protein M3479_09810 [Actinomycetota bacterium]|nr:hypothetical protein [Actinomycetota bacterium]